MEKALIYTLLSGIVFLIGIILVRKIKNREKMSVLAISVAFIVMLLLAIFDLIPEIYESKNWMMILVVFGGFLILYFLDKLIPHHHHEHHEHNDNIIEHNSHLNHIGVITLIALTFHNMIEGMSLYNLTIKDSHLGLLMLISVSLHNLPLGFQIGGCLSNSFKSKLLMLLLVFSAFIGGLIILILGNPSELFVTSILSLTLGMLIYIIFWELLAEIKINIHKKEVFYGIIIGCLVFFLTTLL